MDSAFNNQSDPTDQDSRTSFPDKDAFGTFAPAQQRHRSYSRFESRRRRSRKRPPLAMSAKQVSAAREVREGVFGRGGPPVWFGPGRSKLVQAFRLRHS